MHKVTDGLKKFAHVNKKAFEQYNNFTKQRDDLLKRREELDTSSESIQELIGTLDQRKDEAIARTFKQVSKYFEEVFEKLVPAGQGRLVMQRRIDEVGHAMSTLTAGGLPIEYRELHRRVDPGLVQLEERRRPANPTAVRRSKVAGRARHRVCDPKV